jgi:hypothetical protein
MFFLEKIKRRKQTVKKYFNKRAKDVKFKLNEKVIIWDSTHANRGKHLNFKKLWLSPCWARDMITFMMVIIHFCYMYICFFHLLKELFEEFHDKMV